MSEEVRTRFRLPLCLLALAALAPLPRGAAAQDASLYAFAPRGALHRDDVRYRLPYPLKIPRFLSQGPGGTPTHQHEPDYHAFDFMMPKGTPVLAARRGRVARVRDGYTEGGVGERFKGTGNTVWVLHDDGTFAVYHHLSPGIPVEEGRVVKRGGLLGHSGQTGYAAAPHLHFVVRRLTHAGRPTSVPIRFGGRRGYVPEVNQYYGNPPRPNARMHLYLGERELGPGFHAARVGQALQLRIVVVQRDGTRRDVTADPGTELATMTPWNVDVAEGGRLVFRPVEGFDFSDIPELRDVDLSKASVAVFHGERGDPVVALGRVEFQIRDGE